MRAISKYVRYFENQDEYDVFYDTHEHFGYRTDIVENKNDVSADATYECKSWKTAVKRFFAAISIDRRFDGWDEECFIEAIGNGHWNDKSTVWNDETGRCEYTGDYAWGVEELDDGLWYIFLKVAK